MVEFKTSILNNEALLSVHGICWAIGVYQ